MPTEVLLPDALARKHALRRDESFIVQAPAGSGKTSLLVNRFLTLLGVVERPESIVAMTFTRKAAGEMKERIVRALHDSASDLASAARAQDERLGWNLLRDPGRLQIQTIDSLCATIVRQMPLVSESGGIGQVMEEASELYRLAARRMLQNLAEGADAGRQLFVRASLFFDNNVASLEGKVASLLEKRDQWEFYPLAPHSDLVDDFGELLRLAHAELREVFRLRSSVDFTEITRAAITALGSSDAPSDLLYSLDYQIVHLMVDEFQDTSRAQYDLVNALTGQWSEGDGRTLFLVGDPSQSIYRFRSAEVSLFLRAWEEKQLGSVRLKRLRLSANFRSTPELVGWVNEFLGPLMPIDNSATGAVKLQPASAIRPPSGAQPVLIPFLNDMGEAEAAAVLEIVRTAEQRGGVAILVRSRAHVKDILPVLRNAGIRYEAVEIDPLQEQQHVLDMLALTRALVHLADRVSWLACLRAPWCGLTLADLSSLAEPHPSRTIFHLLGDPAVVHTLSPDGRLRAIRFFQVAAEAVGHLGRIPLRQLVEETWIALGGSALLPFSNQREDVDTFLSLLERFEEGGTVRDFSLLAQRVEQLNAKPDTGADCVRVMTIHAAKGLEFDTVILPQFSRSTRVSESELLLWTENTDDQGNVHLHVAAQPQTGEDSTPEYKNIKEEIKLKDRREDERLLYVACTRAVNHLYLLGSVKVKKDGTIGAPSEGTFLKMIWPQYQAQFQELLGRRLPRQSSLDFQEESGSKQTFIRRVPLSWHPPLSPQSVEWQPELVRSTASARTVTYEWVSDTGRHVGTVVHNVLKRIASDGVAAWDRTRLSSSLPLYTQELQRLGVPAADLTSAVDRVLRAITNTIRSSRGQWILTAHPEAESELAIQGRVRNRLITGSIDRCFRHGSTNRLWIVDYKTSEHQGGNLQDFLDNEVQRYRDQMETYATLLSRLRAGPIHLGLYFPLLDDWREWAFAEESVAAGDESRHLTS